MENKFKGKNYIYNNNKEMLSCFSTQTNFLYWANFFKYPPHIKALLDENMSDDDFKIKYPSEYDEIMRIPSYRIQLGGETRIEQRTNMEFARDLASNFVVEDIIIELLNRCGGNAKCKLNDVDASRDILQHATHDADFLFTYDNGMTANVDLKCKFLDSPFFNIKKKTYEDYRDNKTILLIVNPINKKYSVINLSKVQVKPSSYNEKDVYFKLNYKSLDLRSKEGYKQMLLDVQSLI